VSAQLIQQSADDAVVGRVDALALDHCAQVTPQTVKTAPQRWQVVQPFPCSKRHREQITKVGSVGESDVAATPPVFALNCGSGAITATR
jgi:hypothetical protein